MKFFERHPQYSLENNWEKNKQLREKQTIEKNKQLREKQTIERKTNNWEKNKNLREKQTIERKTNYREKNRQLWFLLQTVLEKLSQWIPQCGCWLWPDVSSWSSRLRPQVWTLLHCKFLYSENSRAIAECNRVLSNRLTMLTSRLESDQPGILQNLEILLIYKNVLDLSI